MNFPLPVLPFLAIVVAAIGAVIDVYTTKIPNKLTFPAAGLGILLNFAMHGPRAALFAFLGWLIGAFLMILPDPKRKMGFGDAKLMAAMGAFLGPRLVLLSWGFFALLFGFIATMKLLGAFPWTQVPKMLQAATVGMKMRLDMYAAQRINQAMNTPIALGPLIAIGTTLAIVLEKPTLKFLGFS